MPVPLRAALRLTLALSVAGCFVLPERPRIEPVPAGERIEEKSPPQRAPSERGIMPKRVTGKQHPNILLAGDGTSCTVSDERYRKVQVGKHEICAWR
jgi:hypothetical protein